LEENDEHSGGHIADVFTFRDGKAIQFRTFADERPALEWAGVDSRLTT
jgi:ketosteroid isomerase-like protein